MCYISWQERGSTRIPLLKPTRTNFVTIKHPYTTMNVAKAHKLKKNERIAIKSNSRKYLHNQVIFNNTHLYRVYYC